MMASEGANEFVGVISPEQSTDASLHVPNRLAAGYLDAK